MSRIGRKLRDDVRTRIRTQDGGRWAKPGKWIKAKKDRRKSLVGTAKMVSFKSTKDKTVVLATTPGDWTLTQHDKGFTKSPEGGRVTLKLKRPSALDPAPKGDTISFIAKRASRTPARKIWPDRTRAERIVKVVGQRWLKEVVAKAVRKAGGRIANVR